MLPPLHRWCLISFACALWLPQAAAAVCSRLEPSDVFGSTQTTTHSVPHRTGLHSQSMHTCFNMCRNFQARFDLETSRTELSSCLIWSSSSFLLSRNPDDCKWELMQRSSRKFWLLQSETDCAAVSADGLSCLINFAHICLIYKHHGIKRSWNIQTWCQSPSPGVPRFIFSTLLRKSSNLTWGKNSQRVLKKNSRLYMEHTHIFRGQASTVEALSFWKMT